MKKLPLKLRSKKGFSLVECVMAIALFAVLSAIALQILATSVEVKRRNQELIASQNGQMKLIASGDIRHVGIKKGEDPLFEMKTDTGHEIKAKYVSYNSSSGSYIISKPNYDLSDIEKELLEENFTDMFANTPSGAIHPNNKVYSNATLGDITIENVENITLAQPVTVDGVDYSQTQTYEITFALASEPPPNLTTFQIPENCYLASVKASNCKASLLNESISGSYANMIRLSEMRGSVKITLTFYLNSTDCKYIGFLGATGNEILLSPEEGTNVYRKGA